MNQDKAPSNNGSNFASDQTSTNTDSKINSDVNKWEQVRITENEDLSNTSEETNGVLSKESNATDSSEEAVDWKTRYEALAIENEKLKVQITELASQEKKLQLYHNAELKTLHTRAMQDNKKAQEKGYEAALLYFTPLEESITASLSYANGTIEQYREGAQQILNQMKSILKKLEVTIIDPSIGETFDPYTHSAIGTEVIDQAVQAPDTIVKVLQKGYRLKNRTIKSAMVIVSKAKE